MARGNAGTITYTRDDTRRVTGYTWSNGSLSGSASFGYDTAGRVNSSEAVSGGVTITQSFGYNSLGRLSSVTQNNRTAQVGYEVNGRLQSIGYPSGMQVVYENDKDGRITAIKHDGSTLASYVYDTAGRLTSHSCQWSDDRLHLRSHKPSDIHRGDRPGRGAG